MKKLTLPSELKNIKEPIDKIENPDIDDVITEEAVTEDIGEQVKASINLNPVVNISEDNRNTVETNTNILVGPENDPIQATIKGYESFDKNAWNKKSGYKLPHFPFIQQKLEGLDEGLYLFAAESNAG